jgi:hypothetical protein
MAKDDSWVKDWYTNPFAVIPKMIQDKLGFLSEEEKKKLQEELKKDMEQEIPKGTPTYAIDPDKGFFGNLLGSYTATGGGVLESINWIIGGFVIVVFILLTKE